MWIMQAFTIFHLKSVFTSHTLPKVALREVKFSHTQLENQHRGKSNHNVGKNYETCGCVFV